MYSMAWGATDMGETPAAPRGQRILVIDDTPANLGVVADYLDSCGFEALTAKTGAKGLEIAAAQRPNLILLDVLMPDMDGFEVCRRLKADHATRGIPVIFMTALAGVEDKVTGFNVGGVDYVTKPIQQEELLVRVKTHLRIQAQEAELEEKARRLAELNTAKDSLLRQLEDMQKGLVRSARQAGMAEIASSVLHNIGNALNPLVVSSQMMAARAASGRTASLVAKLGELLGSGPQAERWSPDDPRLRQVPALAKSLAVALAAERMTDRDDLARIGAGIERICKSIAAQQQYIGGQRVVEEVDLSEVVEDALELRAPAFARNKIKVERRLPSVVWRVERYRLMQILLNLFSNAAEAMADSPEPRTLTVSLEVDGGHALVSVADTGCGIPAENIPKLFKPGFTTKRGGVGFGLDSAANNARAMGATIVPHSAGPGQGARFTIRLPPCAP